MVAIRKIHLSGILFFTQRDTRKVSELVVNPRTAMTFWFSLQQRQVCIEGKSIPLEDTANKFYWNTLPRDRQLCFSPYVPISGLTYSLAHGIGTQIPFIGAVYR